MARKSRWAQFSEAFNSTYGTFGQALGGFESAKVMKDDFGGLQGSELDRARYEALAAIKTKYGDAEGGLKLRTQAAGLEGQTFTNDVNAATKDEQIFQKGAGGSGLLRAQTNSANAGAANNYSAANARDTMLPYDVQGKVLSIEGQGLSNSYDSQTLDYRVDQAGSAARTAGAEADVAQATTDAQITEAEANADEATARASDAIVDAEIKLKTSDDELKAQIAEINERAATATSNTATAEQAARDRSIATEIYQSAMGMDFESEEAATAWMVDQISKSDMTLAGQSQYATTIGEFGAMKVGVEAEALTKKLESAAKQGGLPSVIDALNEVDDGTKETIIRRDGQVILGVETEDGKVEPLFSIPDGPEADTIMLDAVLRLAKDPSIMMSLVVEQAQREKTKAETKDIEASAGLKQSQAEENRVDTEDKVNQRNELSLKDRWKQIETMKESEIYLGADEVTQKYMLHDEKSRLGLLEDWEQRPDDWAPADWLFLKPEEQKELWSSRK